MSKTRPRPSAASAVNSLDDPRGKPVAVIKAEVPNLAKKLGMKPADLFKQLTGAGGLASGDCRCCGNDSF